nr:hypothetical protein [uncultured Albidiferax sp.]
MSNPLKVHEGMLVFTVSEGIVRDMQKRAAAAGIRAVHIVIDGFRSGVSVAEFSYVDEVVALASMSRLPEGRLTTATMDCLANTFNAVDEEIRQRNLVHANPRRLAVLSDGVAFGIDANAIEVAWVFAWATHRVSSLVPYAVAAAAKEAWGGCMKDGEHLLNWLARWADTQGPSGVCHRCLTRSS